VTRLPPLLRYGLVGLASNGLGYLAYLALTATGLPPKVTMTALYLTATAIAFVGNRRFTFDDNGRIGPAALRFGVVYLVGWLLNLSLLVVFVDHLGQPHWLVQGAAILIVAAVLFLLQRRFVFRNPTDPRSP
jgi:putative flippase GtrA